jgi:hypothetical protein
MRSEHGPFALFLVLLLVAAAGAAAPAARRPGASSQAEAELLAIHALDRKAHMETNVDLILKHADETFVSVANGKIHRSTKADAKAMFEGSFAGATYQEWDDLEAPVVRVSDDGTMGWMIVRIRSRRTKKDAAGAEKQEQFVYAGIMTYEKKGGRWVRTANVSTFEK